jgi:hypothetical protein
MPASDQQAAALGERRPPIEQPGYVPGAASDAGEQLGRRGAGVAASQIGYSEVDRVQGCLANVGCLGATSEFDQFGVVLVLRGDRFCVRSVRVE